MAGFINQIERNWLARHVTGATPKMPIGQLRRLYYVTYLGGTIPSKESLADLEFQWLLKYLNTAGVTPSSDYNADLWKQMASTTGQTPQRTQNGNRMLFFSNAA